MIGLLRHRINIKKKTKVPDGRGGWKQGYQDLGTFWAGVYPLRGREIEIYKSVLPEADTKIIMRCNNVVDSSCIAYLGDRKFEISAVIVSATRDRFIEILAKEVVDRDG
ncbi:MAG: phage head closure protein [Candidatus Heimdallarchaeaceae archaeon]